MDMLAAPLSEGSESLRSAMRAWTTGVAIVTAVHAGRPHGMTVSSFTSISLDPPLIVISLSTGSHTHDLIRLAGAFGVTILAASQQALSERFAGRQAGERIAWTGCRPRPSSPARPSSRAVWRSSTAG